MYTETAILHLIIIAHWEKKNRTTRSVP